MVTPGKSWPILTLVSNSVKGATGKSWPIFTRVRNSLIKADIDGNNKILLILTAAANQIVVWQSCDYKNSIRNEAELTATRPTPEIELLTGAYQGFDARQNTLCIWACRGLDWPIPGLKSGHKKHYVGCNISPLVCTTSLTYFKVAPPRAGIDHVVWDKAPLNSG